MIRLLRLLTPLLPFAAGLSTDQQANRHQLNRRDALIGAAASSGLLLPPTYPAVAADATAETIDIAAFNAARAKSAPVAAKSGAGPPSSTSSTKKVVFLSVAPSTDPSPLLPIRGERNGKSTIKIPRVGYSFYKTPADQAVRCTSLALRAGVRHFDLATLYKSNVDVSKALKKYLDIGMSALNFKEEKAELMELLDATAAAGEQHALQTITGRSTFKSKAAPPPDGSAGRRGRREGLFLSHKLSNAEQSTDAVAVRRTVKNAIAELGAGYLDMVSIHTPLTDKSRRLATYQALLDLRDSGFVKTVGVCNYGLGPLKEIEKAELDLPAINQLELSPFNRHEDVVGWCGDNGVAVGCGAWSKLSGVDGPAEGWAVLSDVAKAKGMTKAQVLVRWAMQKGYVCVPRSASASKVERVAIAENSYGGVNPSGGAFVLSAEEMKVLDGLDIGYRAGKLGRRDGWDDADVSGPEWDPTDFV